VFYDTFLWEVIDMALPFTVRAVQRAAAGQVIRTVTVASAAIAFVVCPVGARAIGVAQSADYSLDFALVASSGAVASTPSYQVLERVITKGVAVSPAASAAYELEPVGATSTPTSAIYDWSLY
jgi:hypothetical protein